MRSSDGLERELCSAPINLGKLLASEKQLPAAIDPISGTGLDGRKTVRNTCKPAFVRR
jgi:hypothetical protein